jgi:putative oxidoreductase
MLSDNKPLIIAGILSMLAAILHIGVIIGGPAWYRFFGAGEGMARMAEKGMAYPAIATAVIALVLFIWAAYAFSGAGVITRLPLLKAGLVVISLIFVARGVFGIVLMNSVEHPSFSELQARPIFLLVTSIICFVCAFFYILGSVKRWDLLSVKGIL